MILILDCPIDGLDHRARVTPALVIEHPQIDEVRSGRHTHDSRIRIRPCGCDASDMRSVSVRILTATVRIDEVNVHDDTSSQVRMVANTRVKDCNSNAETGHAPSGVETVPHLVGAYRGRSHGHCRLDNRV